MAIRKIKRRKRRNTRRKTQRKTINNRTISRRQRGGTPKKGKGERPQKANMVTCPRCGSKVSRRSNLERHYKTWLCREIDAGRRPAGRRPAPAAAAAPAARVPTWAATAAVTESRLQEKQDQAMKKQFKSQESLMPPPPANPYSFTGPAVYQQPPDFGQPPDLGQPASLVPIDAPLSVRREQLDKYVPTQSPSSPQPPFMHPHSYHHERTAPTAPPFAPPNQPFVTEQSEQCIPGPEQLSSLQSSTLAGEQNPFDHDLSEVDFR